MKTCPKCQAMISDTAKFCVKCGFNIKKYEEENVQQEYFCPECGTKFSGGAFCPECGTSINGHLSEDAGYFPTSLEGFDFSALQNEAQTQLNENELSAFEFEKMSNGKYVIKKLKNSSELIIVVPDCVQMIEANAFENSSIIDITLPEGLIKIGTRAFANCKDLEKINMPSTLKIIEEEAFLDCSHLDLEAPQYVRCGKDVFKGTLLWVKEQQCKEESERKRKEEDEHQRLQNIEKRKYTPGLTFRKYKDTYKVTGYSGDKAKVLIPSIYKDLPVETIADGAFANAGINSIVIPDSVTKIDSMAFAGSDIKSIVIPNSVTVIGSWVFKDCYALKKITIPDSITDWGKMVFLDCQGITIKASRKMANKMKSMMDKKQEPFFNPHIEIKKIEIIE